MKTDISKLTESERTVIEARRRYQREWRAANKEKVQEHNRRYWCKKAAEYSANGQTKTAHSAATL